MDITSSISDRFMMAYNYLISSSQVSDKKDFAVKIGVSPSMITEISKGRSNVGTTAIQNIVIKFGLSSDWLLTGVGEMLREQSFIYKDEQNKELTAIQAEKGIPLIPLEAFAGFGTENSTQIFEYECEKYVIPNFKGAEFLIQVRGSSMYPKYASGDIVACKKLPIDTFFQWNKVYVLDTDQGVLIKRVKKAEDSEHVTLVSENEKYEAFEVHRSDIHSLAIVIGVIRLE